MTKSRLVAASWAGTAIFVAASVVGVAFDGGVRVAAAAVDVVLFAAGVVAYLWAYAVAVNRSRTDEMGIGGLFFLAGDTVDDAGDRTSLRLSLATQIVVALVAASLRPFTAVAFGVLVPVLGLGVMGLYGARFGQFAPRVRR